jgi:hypothetical protein
MSRHVDEAVARLRQEAGHRLPRRWRQLGERKNEGGGEEEGDRVEQESAADADEGVGERAEQRTQSDRQI